MFAFEVNLQGFDKHTGRSVGRAIVWNSSDPHVIVHADADFESALRQREEDVTVFNIYYTRLRMSANTPIPTGENFLDLPQEKVTKLPFD